jgi:hypothetical protein
VRLPVTADDLGTLAAMGALCALAYLLLIL